MSGMNEAGLARFRHPQPAQGDDGLSEGGALDRAASRPETQMEAEVRMWRQARRTYWLVVAGIIGETVAIVLLALR